MKRFEAHELLKAMRMLQELGMLAPDRKNDRLCDGYAKMFRLHLDQLITLCREWELPVGALRIEKLIEVLDSGKEDTRPGIVDQGVMQIASTVEDELSLKTCLFIPASSALLYKSPSPLGAEVPASFPRTIVDAEEAAKCYACARYTACVFHLQRILEVGLKSLAKKLNKPFDRNSWDAHLKDIEKELELRYKTAGARTPDEALYSNAATLFGHIKTAWRNPTMHIENVYDGEKAMEVFSAVRAFMRHLAANGISQPEI